MTPSPATRGRPQSHDWASVTPQDWKTLTNRQIADMVGCTDAQVAARRHYGAHPSGRTTRWDRVTDWTASLRLIASQACCTKMAASYQKKKRLAMQANVNNK